jgi:hypothetical protein
MPKLLDKPLSVVELAKLHGVPKHRVRRWLKTLDRERGGVLFRFAENGRLYTTLALLRAALPEAHSPPIATEHDVETIQQDLRELKAIVRLLRSRYRVLRADIQRSNRGGPEGKPRA